MKVFKGIQKNEGNKGKGQKGGRNTPKGSSRQQQLSPAGSQGHTGGRTTGSKKSGR